MEPTLRINFVKVKLGVDIRVNSLYTVQVNNERDYIMQVAVIHTAFEESPRTVAFVNIPEDARSTDEALEYAYRWTNNVMGSWSRTDIEDNGDYNPDVTVMASLGEGGMGLRSTSMGDQMLIGNKKYKVAAFGFEEI